MFSLNKSSETKSLPNDEYGNDVVYTWRWLSPENYYLDEGGACKAKSAAFDIRRDPNGTPKEPSASLFQMKTAFSSVTSDAVILFSLLPFSKETTEGSAVGALNSHHVDDLKKDPRFRTINEENGLFTISPSINQKNKKLIHWDLSYSKDDREKEIQDLKTALARICQCEPKLTTNSATLRCIEN